MHEKRISEWLGHLVLPLTVELRCKDETISSVVATETETAATELVQDANDDAAAIGRTRIYKLVAIDEGQQRFVCPFRITINQQSNHDQQRVLADHNIELNKLLIAERKDDRKILLDIVESQGRMLKRSTELVERLQNQRADYWEKHEQLKSQEQERQLEREREEKHNELIERGADVAIPLLTALVNKFTGGKLPMLPAVDGREIALRETVKAMTETQVAETLPAILGDRWPELQVIISGALNGRADVQAFRRFAQSLSPEMQMAIVAQLNIGQQAALETVLQDDTQN